VRGVSWLNFWLLRAFEVSLWTELKARGSAVVAGALEFFEGVVTQK